jgi:hypothetical protein
MFLLDTDNVSLDQRGHPEVRQRLQRSATLELAIKCSHCGRTGTWQARCRERCKYSSKTGGCLTQANTGS